MNGINTQGVTDYCGQICGGGECGTGPVCHYGIDSKPDDPNGTACEIDDENPDFFSVYAHIKDDGTYPEFSGVECVGHDPHG